MDAGAMSALPEVLGLPVRVPDVTRGAPFVFDRIGPSIEAIRVVDSRETRSCAVFRVPLPAGAPR
jgi:hypothetical protein